MLCNSLQLKQDLAPLREARKYNVVMAYEDFITGIDAIRALVRLSERSFEFHELGTDNVWSFEHLDFPVFGKIAAIEAAKANMIIIAAHGSGRVPDAVIHWAELWIGQHTTCPAALVLLLDGADREVQPFEDYFKQCARRAEMNFFVRAVGKRLAVDNYNFEVIAKRAQHTSAALARILLNLPNNLVRTENKVLGGAGGSNLRSSSAKIGEAWKNQPAVSCPYEYAGPILA